jgi:hypothetical protein
MDARFSDCVQMKRKVFSSLNRTNIFDTNLNNYLTEQRKIIQRKNDELDKRAASLDQYGFQGDKILQAGLID